METNETKMNIWQKILEIQKVCTYFQKDKKSFHYKYVTGASILAKVIEKKNEVGLLLYPEITNYNVTKDGKKTTFSGEGHYIWIDTDTGERYKIAWVFLGDQDDISKAGGSALTYYERYFLLKFFGIPTDEDDPDKWEEKKDNNVDDKQVKQSQQAKPTHTPNQISSYVSNINSLKVNIVSNLKTAIDKKIEGFKDDNEAKDTIQKEVGCTIMQCEDYNKLSEFNLSLIDIIKSNS